MMMFKVCMYYLKFGVDNLFWEHTGTMSETFTTIFMFSNIILLLLTLIFTCFNVCFLVKAITSFLKHILIVLCVQRKRHRLALKKQRCLKRKEQAAEYAKLLAQRQKEAKVRRQEEIKRRRSASMRDSKSSAASAPQK